MLTKTLLKLGMVFTTFLLLLNALMAGTGTEGVQFLKIKTSARIASIGDGFVSVSDDVNAVSTNPAGLGLIRNIEASFMHMVYVAETSYESVSVALPVGDNLKIGGNFSFLNYGSMFKTVEDGFGIYSGPNGSFSPFDLVFSLCAGIKLNKIVYIGAGLKYAMEETDGDNTSVFLGDAGILIKSEGFGFGVAVCNIGIMKDDRAPIIGKAGISNSYSLISENDILIALGANYVVAGAKISGSAGFEYCYDNMFTLRGSCGIGYDTDNINVGAGFKDTMDGVLYGIDYNYSLLGNFGTAHRISLTIKLGEKASRNTPAKRSGNSIRKYYNLK
ncbi:MAG: hypothetical protein A2231_00035 [Candidatus Firestonebacteria bacterium RIFOXYA2_FULL_40_8]|nr:MAG: hypothetical protein A2231_00035 [Candidatus Firestonebacteria bacterium RIFOXYA2_FULL_40_8]